MSIDIRHRPFWFASRDPVVHLAASHFLWDHYIFVIWLWFVRFIVWAGIIDISHGKGSEAVRTYGGRLQFEQLCILTVVERKHSFLIGYHVLLGLIYLFVVVAHWFGDQAIQKIILCLVLWQLRCFGKSKGKLSWQDELWFGGLGYSGW